MTNLPDWYYVALINSEFISLYVDNFINNTSHFQINDARQLPIVIPQKKIFESLQKLVADCISLKRTAVIDEILMEEKQYELDRLVRLLYEGVSKPTHPLFISFPPFPDIVFFYAAIFRVV